MQPRFQQQISPDVEAGAAWQTSVHDNDAAGGEAFYSDALIRSRPGYDANRDGRVWVRASATARGRTRTLVALVGAEQQEEPVVQAALITSRLEISNNGNKPPIGANGGLVAVQIAGATPVTAYAGGPASSAEARARLRATAVANGTWFASCPSPAQLTGQVVYVVGGNCPYTGNDQFNSTIAPGLLLAQLRLGQLQRHDELPGDRLGRQRLELDGVRGPDPGQRRRDRRGAHRRPWPPTARPGCCRTPGARSGRAEREAVRSAPCCSSSPSPPSPAWPSVRSSTSSSGACRAGSH